MPPAASSNLTAAENEDFNFAKVDKLGTYCKDESLLQKHIDAVIAYELVDAAAIKKKNFKIVVDAVNSTGAIAVPALLKALCVKDIIVLNEEVNGNFAHNPKEWNALKLLNNKGEFISGDEGKLILTAAENEDFNFAKVDKLGTYCKDESLLQKHIDAVLAYELVDAAAIKKKNFKIIVDAVNSTGAIAVPALLKALGIKDIVVLNGEVNGNFAHNPEPLPEHLTGLSSAVVSQNASLGIAVDPDVDRLCFVCEDGSMFGIVCKVSVYFFI